MLRAGTGKSRRHQKRLLKGLPGLRELVEVSADVTTTAVHGVSPSVTSCTSQVPNQRVGLALRGREDQGTPAFEVRGDTKNSLQDPPLVAFLPAVAEQFARQPLPGAWHRSGPLCSAWISMRATTYSYRAQARMLLPSYTRRMRLSTFTKFCAPRPRHSSSTLLEEERYQESAELQQITASCLQVGGLHCSWNVQRYQFCLPAPLWSHIADEVSTKVCLNKPRPKWLPQTVPFLTRKSQYSKNRSNAKRRKGSRRDAQHAVGWSFSASSTCPRDRCSA